MLLHTNEIVPLVILDFPSFTLLIKLFEIIVESHAILRNSTEILSKFLKVSPIIVDLNISFFSLINLHHVLHLFFDTYMFRIAVYSLWIGPFIII